MGIMMMRFSGDFVPLSEVEATAELQFATPHREVSGFDHLASLVNTHPSNEAQAWLGTYFTQLFPLRYEKEFARRMRSKTCAVNLVRVKVKQIVPSPQSPLQTSFRNSNAELAENGANPIWALFREN